MSSVSMTDADMEIVRRLHEAGIIKLDALRLDSDPRLIEWTMEDFRKDLMARQRYQSATHGRSDSTVEATLRRIRFLEGNGRQQVDLPVQLRPPSMQSWLDHVDYRLTVEEVSPSVLNPYRKTLQRLLRFLEIPEWPCLKTPYPSTPEPWTLPPDDIVPRFWLERLHEDPAVSRTLQYIMHYGFYVGVRPPSELLTLDVQDVDFSNRAITVTEWKKGGRRRLLRGVEAHVVTGKNTKSLKNYLERVRPGIDEGRSDAFFLDPRTGDRWTHGRLQQDLSEAGKRVWSPFVPKTMRRWCATTRLVESDMDIYGVARWIGDKVSTVERYYVDHARAALKPNPSLRRFRAK